MANPNLANLYYTYSKSEYIGVNVTPKMFIQNLNNSNTVIKVNSIIGLNTNLISAANVFVRYFERSSDVFSNIINTTIPPSSNATVLLGRDIGLIMNEGDYIYTGSNLDNSINLIVNYDEISELAPNTSGFVVEYLVVAGGGGGGRYFGGGGGGGGLLNGGLRVYPGFNYSVTVGAGGTGGDNGPAHPQGYQGGNSVFGNSSFSILCAMGGGGGGGGWGGNWPGGEPGGSGGGAITYGPVSLYPAHCGGNGIPGQGNPGGTYNCCCGPLAPSTNGGGGGAMCAGLRGDASPGRGGPGCLLGTNGLLCYYAGGGGAYGAVGGLGGGSGTNTAGCTNTGGGAGGQGPEQGAGQPGGSGIVMVAVSNGDPDIACLGAGLTYTVDRTTRPGFKVYRFTAGTGTVCW